MKYTIKAGASYGGKLPTGPYQNQSPSFYADTEFEVDCDPAQVNGIINESQKQLQEVCWKNFEAEAERAKLMKIQADRKDFRFYKTAEGEEYPSVTTIRDFDSDPWVSDEELKQYAAQGTIIDLQVRHFIQAEEWLAPKDLQGTAPYLYILKTGKLKLPTEGWSFKNFLEKHPLKKMKVGKPVFNHVLRYAGEYDFECEYEGVPTLCDVTRSKDKTSKLIQMSAYAKCEGMEHIKKIMIVNLTADTKQGFSAPETCDDWTKYAELFAYKRRDFGKVYGI